MTATTPTLPDYTKFLAEKQEIRNLKAARTRCWGAYAKTLLLGPIGSVWQSVVTDNWVPTLVASGVWICCIPIAAVDMGFTLAVAPPVTAAAMFASKASKSRKMLQMHSPEQAEAALAVKGIF